MRTNLRIEAVQWAIIVTMFILAAIVWPSAPNRIPVHWGLSGDPDRYGGKIEGLLLLPLVTLGAYLLMLFIPRLDPRRDNYILFQDAYGVLRVSVVVFLALVYGLILLWVRGIELDVAVVIPVLVGALLVVMGNLLGKIRPNWFVGVKTPWTLSSTRSWVKTHRMAGWTVVLLGLTLVVLGFLGSNGGVWVFATIALASVASVLWLFVYSYLVWRSDPDKTSETGIRGAGR